jgi:hypothetical protein
LVLVFWVDVASVLFLVQPMLVLVSLSPVVLLLTCLIFGAITGLICVLCCYWFIWLDVLLSAYLGCCVDIGSGQVVYSLFGLSGLVRPKLVPDSWDVPLLPNIC